MLVLDKKTDYRPRHEDLIFDGEVANKVKYKTPRSKSMKNITEFRDGGAHIEYKTKEIKTKSVLKKELRLKGDNAEEDFKTMLMMVLGVEQLELDSNQTVWLMLEGIKALGYYIIFK